MKRVDRAQAPGTPRAFGRGHARVPAPRRTGRSWRSSRAGRRARRFSSWRTCRGRCSRPSWICRPSTAGRRSRWWVQPVPAHRRAAILPHARALQLLLVRAENVMDTRAGRSPISTYRLPQLHAGFPFAAARGNRAVSGDPRHWRPLLLLRSSRRRRAARTATTSPTTASQRGAGRRRPAYDALRRHARPAGLGHVLDFVPNHMGIEPATQSLVARRARERAGLGLRAVLRYRLDPVKPELSDKVLLPILGDQYGDVLERGELQLGFRGRRVLAALLRTALPLNPRLYPSSSATTSTRSARSWATSIRTSANSSAS